MAHCGFAAYLVVEAGLQLRPTDADPAAGTTDTAATAATAHHGLRGGDHVRGTQHVAQCVPRTRLVLHLLDELIGGDAASAVSPWLLEASAPEGQLATHLSISEGVMGPHRM